MVGQAKAVTDLVGNLATQRVIGYSRTKTYTKGKKNPKVISESLNVGIQAWELGILLASVAVYDYVEGPGSLLATTVGAVRTPYSAGIYAIPSSGSLAGLP